MSDEPRTSRRSRRFGGVTGVLLLVATIAVAVLLYQLGDKVGKLSRRGEELEHEQVVAAIASFMDEAGVSVEDLAPVERTVTRSQPCTACPACLKQQATPARARPQYATRSDDKYEFDPTYGMRSRSEIDRLRPKRMETGAEYKRMYEECRRQAKTPTLVTDWDVFARDINRQVPTAAEFSAVLRGDRSIWAVD